MNEDGLLLGLVATVWAVLAAIYGFVPMFDMPGSALVWGAGAILFAVLTALVIRADAVAVRVSRRREPSAHVAERSGVAANDDR
jgi:hypothetical protein